MRRSLVSLLWLFLASQAAAQAPSPAQLGITPTTLPEVVQVLDNTKTWVTIGTVDPSTHVFTPVAGGSGFTGEPEADILVTDPSIGMIAGGFDNSPRLQALMNAQSSVSGATRGYDVLFPRSNATGQQWTEYYFSAPFVNSRIANYHCPAGTQYPSVNLVFAAGVDGFIEEDPAVTPDGKTGGGKVSGCGIVSMGMGQAVVDLNHTPTVLTSVAFFGDPAGVIPLSTWHVGDGLILLANANAGQPSSAIPAAPLGTTIASVGSGTVTLSAPVSTSLGGNGVPIYAKVTFTETGSNNFVNNDVLQLGASTYTFQTAAIGISTAPMHILIGKDFPTSVANLLAAINGTAGQYNTYSPNTSGENAFLQDVWVSASYASGVITFTTRYGGLNTNSFPSVYTPAGTAAGSFSAATFSGAVPNAQQLYFYQLPATQAFKIQTTAGSDLVTIVSGPRKVYGGDVIVSDAFPFGSAVFGPISGTVGAQTVHIHIPSHGLPQNATVTHAPGAEGNMWIMPAGLYHRVTNSTAEDMTISYFPIGTFLGCSSGGGVNCDATLDQNVMHILDMVGRWVAGNNTSASTSIHEIFVHSTIMDIFEGGTLGEIYINPNLESPEGGQAKWSAIKDCVNLNQSMVFGSYTSGGNSGCANPTSVFPPTWGGLEIFGALNGGIAGAPYYVGNTHGNGLNVQGGPDQSHEVCMEVSPSYAFDLAISFNGCATTQTMGIGWSASGGYWYWAQNVSEAMRFIYPAAGYTGYSGYTSFSVGLMEGAIIGGELNGAALARQFETSFAKPIYPAHAAGDSAINISAGPGGRGLWYDAPIFSTTLTAPVAVGATTAAVAACPTATIPASLFLSDMGAIAIGAPKTLGTYVSCTSSVMAISAALNAGVTGDTVKILQWTGAAPISNDPNNPDYTATTIRSGVSSNTDLTGRIALSGGAATYTLVGKYATAPNCLTADTTTPANANSVSESVTTLTFSGTGTDTIKWICAGRN